MAKRILVVEDDPVILEAVVYNLETEGYKVDTASDGTDGLEAARKLRPDIVLLDIMLPNMSGLDVCRLLKDELDQPIILMTARDAEIDVLNGFDCGADDYITKPFSMRLMRARVSALLRRSTKLETEVLIAHEDTVVYRIDQKTAVTNIAPIIKTDCLELDTIAHEIKLDGQLLEVRPREFELLEFFMRHPRQALSRELLLESVWGYEFRGDTRTVDVHIRWLRKKIEVNPAIPTRIITVRSVGYKFMP
ncbi:MAG: response regulator transcription factor [Chloroflexota bacterium]|nr:response regulator transcription factor [Chloroflexota bacterium]